MVYVYECIRERICNLRSYTHSSFSQLVMFQALQRESPMLLLQLGITSEFMDNEMKKITEIEKTKVLYLNILNETISFFDYILSL